MDNFKCVNPDHNEFIYNGTSSTCLGWFPRYNKKGELLNKDPNTHTTDYKCLVCNKRYKKVRHMGETKFYDIDIGGEI